MQSRVCVACLIQSLCGCDLRLSSLEGGCLLKTSPFLLSVFFSPSFFFLSARGQIQHHLGPGSTSRPKPLRPTRKMAGEAGTAPKPPGGPRRWAGAPEETSMSASVTPDPHPCTSTKAVAGQRHLPPRTLHARSATRVTAVTPRDPPVHIHTTHLPGLRRTTGCTSKRKDPM